MRLNCMVFSFLRDIQKGARLREILPLIRKYVFETSARKKHPRYHSNCDDCSSPLTRLHQALGAHAAFTGRFYRPHTAFFLPARKIQMLSELSFTARTNRRFSVTEPSQALFLIAFLN